MEANEFGTGRDRECVGELGVEDSSGHVRDEWGKVLGGGCSN